MFATHFYNKTIRIYTAIFGTMFNEIKIVKKAETFDVPLSYVGGEKHRIKNDEDSSTKGKVKMTLPRMSFRLSGWQLDQSRKQNRMNVRSDTFSDAEKTSGTIQTQRERVPYNFNFQLQVKTKTIDEMLQIVEQILTGFDPFVDVNVIDNSSLNESTMIRINLESNDFQDQFEGSFEEYRELETTFTFSIEGYLYKATQSSDIIKTINIDINSDELFLLNDFGHINIDTNVDLNGTTTITD